MTHALVGWGRAASRVLAQHRPRWGAEDTSLLHPFGRSLDCQPLQQVPGPSSKGGLGGKEGPTSLPDQDSGVHFLSLAGWWPWAAPGGRGSPGAGDEWSHRTACIRTSPRRG